MELYLGESKWSRNIKEQTRRLSGLMQDLLTLARMDEGAAPAQKAALSLSGLAEQALEPLPAAHGGPGHRLGAGHSAGGVPHRRPGPAGAAALPADVYKRQALGDGRGLACAILGGGGHASPFHGFLGLPHAPLPRALPAAPVVHGAHGGDVHRGGVHQAGAVLTLSLVGRGDGALQLALDALGSQQAEVLQGLHPRLECPRQWPRTGRRCPRAP